MKITDCCSLQNQRWLVRKAHKTGHRPTPSEIIRLQSLSDKKEERIAAEFVKGLDAFLARIPAEALEAAAEQGRDALESLIPYDDLVDDLDFLSEETQEIMIGAALMAIGFLVVSTRNLQFDPTHERIARVNAANAGLLLQAISDENRIIIQATISRTLGQAPALVAEQIRTSVGLTPKMNTALQTFRAKQIADGLSAVQVARLVKDKRDRMIDVRAMAIARTEGIRAVNAGQMELWRQAAEQGVIDADKARKVWLTVNDDRRSAICDQLDGHPPIPLNELFFSSIAGESFDYPPAHVNCRSAVVLEGGGA